MSGYLELYANKNELSRYFENHYPEIYQNIGQSHLVPLRNKNILNELNESNIVKFAYRDSANGNKYYVPLVVKGILMLDTGIYLIDEFEGSHNNKVSVPGGHLEEAYYFENYGEDYIASEFVRELREETTLSGRKAWTNLLDEDKCDIVNNLKQCGLPGISVSDSWYCNYIESRGDRSGLYEQKGEFIIYIPIYMGYEPDNPKLIPVMKKDYLSMRSAINVMPKRTYMGHFNIETNDDARYVAFDNVISPIFNSFDEVHDIFTIE